MRACLLVCCCSHPRLLVGQGRLTGPTPYCSFWRVCGRQRPASTNSNPLPLLLRQDPEALKFRQLPTFEDCFPESEKHYREVDHHGTLLRVSGEERKKEGIHIGRGLWGPWW